MLEHYGAGSIRCSGIHNKLCCLYGNVVVYASGLCPQPRGLSVTMLLCLLYTVDAVLQRVVFSRQFKKVPAGDRAVRMYERDARFPVRLQPRKQVGALCISKR